MARKKNEATYADTREKLLSVGLKLIRANSYAAVGISDILREANVPKGSFYHYFSSKEEFAVEVSRFYNAEQLATAEKILKEHSTPALARLKSFFQMAYDDFEARDFSQGCLMCNLSTELSEEHTTFKQELSTHWTALCAVIADCISELDKSEIGLTHLSDKEAADWLLNAWSGALTRMKAVQNGSPLQLFLKTTFRESR
ncbi:TetR/AcrR family transcriptional regulator [Sneathiella glossodoripedis]|uniref:TetR/AcrR family transcriptional regulator n=1 Tax=Sneathiella glossodoripedis TaxID=418853 RepID=UPI00046E542A|nr:TetR/AcrR family transcriptional regulator [Sneathiella glossodoripedis]